MSSADAHESGTYQAPGMRSRNIISIVLVVLAIGGIAIMDYKPEWGLWYWLAMVPIFAGASIGMTWQAGLVADQPRPVMVRRQLLHWSVLLLGFLMVYLMLHFTDLDATHSGFIALMLLSVTTMLAGVHFWWRFGVLGLILAATLVASVLVEHFFMALLLLTILVIVMLLFFRRRDARVDRAG